MDPGPDVETHHHHHSGHRWLDMVLALSAILISGVSLYVAVQHGKTMEKMVEANTWPYVEFGASNGTPTGEHQVSLVVQNSGVGPARVDTLELAYDGKPMGSVSELLKACCVRPEEPRARFQMSTVSGRVMPAKEVTTLLQEGARQMTPAQLQRLDDALPKITTRICYCSVLDACWTRDSAARAPVKVKACPEPKVAFAN